MAYGIWNNRNNIRQGATSKTASGIINDAHQYTAEYRNASHHPTPRQVVSSPKFWKPLPLDWYKIKFDAVVFTDARQCGLKVMIRNDSGQLIGALSQILPYLLGAMEAEAKAVVLGNLDPG